MAQNEIICRANAAYGNSPEIFVAERITTVTTVMQRNRRRTHRSAWTIAFLVLFCLGPTMADDAISPSSTDSASGPPATETTGGVRTLGGRQFWGDVRFFRGWRIQHNVLLGQHRLLDPEDKRFHSGTLEECEERLNRFRDELNLKDMSGRAVILIHGIGRSSKSFRSMAKALQEDGYTVVGFDYPSTRVSIPESAEYLHKTIQSLEGIEEIDTVCHSMGGLLLRAYLQKHNEPRFRRAVMLGVPNKGAQMADILKGNPLFKVVLGPAGQQLVTDNDGIIPKLPAPNFPFAVIAGGRSAAKGYNPILPGDNDSTVTVASTRLPGAADFLLLPVIHSFLMNNDQCVEATRHFLTHGQLVHDREPQPISTVSPKTER